MTPQPDYGEKTMRAQADCADKKVLLTGGDPGIGRAVALAFAREGADLVISYLNEDNDARDRTPGQRGRAAMPADAGRYQQGRTLPQAGRETVDAFKRIDVLVNNAAHQMTFNAPEEISDEEWNRTFAVNVSAMFYITKAAIRHMPHGGAINTASINADSPSPHLLAYATTKGAIQDFTARLAQSLAERGIRVNAVAPGPVWTR